MRFGLRLLNGNELCHGCVRKTGCNTGIALPPEAAAKSPNREKAKHPTPLNRVIEVGFDKQEILELS